MTAIKAPKISLKMGLSAIIVSCWLLPIAIVVILSGAVLGSSYRSSVQQETDVSAEYAIKHVETQLDDAIAESKSVSYDGIVRSLYMDFRQSGDNATLYRKLSDYMNQKFALDSRYKAVFIHFWEDDVNASVYMLNSGVTGYDLIKECKDTAPEIVSVMADADTSIYFMNIRGNLYLARNLLDSHFESYASVVMLLDTEKLFKPIEAIDRVKDVRLSIDHLTFYRDAEKKLQCTEADPGSAQLSYTAEVDGHTISLGAELPEYKLWEENSWLRWAVAVAVLMVVPLLFLAIFLFYRHVSRPMVTLNDAYLGVQAGNRGYQITERAPNIEFAKLFKSFNSMSSELESQFQRSYLEQQASQRAQIKALQSQINPHFLNNTLEIINWEARLAENEKVCSMIEALSTMLDAALDRDGRTQIPLREELGYVDAYLYIIRERLGENFRVQEDISQDILDQMIPRLILQPIVENAVEHDITDRRGGNLWIRAGKKGEEIVMEVEHDGSLTENDRASIDALLNSDDDKGAQLGLNNVCRRLKLIYGDKSRITLEETDHGTILAEIVFPAGQMPAGSRDNGSQNK